MVARTLPHRGGPHPPSGRELPRSGDPRPDSAAAPTEASVGSAELMLMLLADARLPTGAHTQSAGLEPAMRHGVSVAEVPELIAARLATVTAVEAGTAVVARHLAIDGRFDGLAAVDEAWQARTVSPALREASALAARGYLRLLRSLWPAAAGLAALTALRHPCRAVVLGVTAAVSGLSAAQLVRLIGNDDAATIAAAVLKIEPVDPVLTTRWVLEAQPQIERLAARLAPIGTIDEIPALAAPLIEEWAELHATTTQRLFRA
ncbi:urease accessory protein UreF [Nakamurella deserti]|uniref:urease accessory protein UreF n=1 Tax=Nakamurella deserti TaxID=2164074 RepID=UPI001F0BB2DE|nr:urease accessory UreF family protein [Nakamurella deserti]